MRARVARAVLAPNHGYVCLSCRLQSVEVEGGRTRRYQHSGPKDEDRSNQVLKNPPENVEKADLPVTSSRIREIIRGFMGGQKTKPLVKETLSSQAANKEAQKVCT